MAETFGPVLICYDIDSKHNEVKEEMKKIGYSDEYMVPSTNTKKKLPETTVWHNYKQVSLAIQDLKLICDNLNVVVENAFAALAKSEVEGYNKPK